MKKYIICINNDQARDMLTLGKKYLVLTEDSQYFKITFNDLGYRHSFYKHRFTKAIMELNPHIKIL